jgi:hypothetical protein
LKFCSFLLYYKNINYPKEDLNQPPQKRSRTALPIPAEKAEDYYAFISSDKLLAFLICHCLSRNFLLWSCYSRKPLPNGEELTIQRVRCKICLKTHALIPTFLFGEVRHSNQTISFYVEQFIKQQTTIGKLFGDPKSPNSPEDISTLYRWFKRLIIRCRSLLPLLKQELINLIPQTDLTEFETIILGKNIDSPYHICRATWLLSEKLLEVSSELLQSEISLTPLTFLNYFCWQNTGNPLLAVLPPKPG